MKKIAQDLRAIIEELATLEKRLDALKLKEIKEMIERIKNECRKQFCRKNI